MTTAVQEEFGWTDEGLPWDALLSFTRTSVASPNPVVRQGALSLISALHAIPSKNNGSKFKTFMDGLLQTSLTPQLQTALQNELTSKLVSSNSKASRPQSLLQSNDTRPTVKNVNAMDVGETEKTSLVEEDKRQDITASITPALLAQLRDPSWKIRKEALDHIASLVDGAGRSIKLSSGELYAELKARLGDSNKILVMQALSLCATLAEASGHSADKLTRPIIGSIMACLGDGKAGVRQEALKCLDAMLTQVCPMVAFVQVASGLIITPNQIANVGDQSGSGAQQQSSQGQSSPTLRAELCSWLAAKIPFHRVHPVEELTSNGAFLAGLAACSQDRTLAVRKATSALLGAVAEVVGGEQVLKREWLKVNRAVPFPALTLPPPPTHPSSASSQTPTANTVFNNVSVKEQPAIPSFRTTLFQQLPPEKRKARLDRDKTVKWTSPEAIFVVRQELVEFVREDLQEVLSSSVTASAVLAFEDFKAQHAALSVLEKAIANNDQSEDAEAVVDALDVLLRLACLILVVEHPNPVVFGKAVDVLEACLRLADQSNYRLSDAEASCILSTLIMKGSDMGTISTTTSSSGGGGNTSSSTALAAKKRRRSEYMLRTLCCHIYPVSKVCTLVIDTLRKAKNTSASIRQAALEDLEALVRRSGSGVACLTAPNKQLPVLAAFLGDRDGGVRRAAQRVLVRIARLMPAASSPLEDNGSIGLDPLGPLAKYLPGLPSRDVDFLVEKLRRSSLQGGLTPSDPEPESVAAHDPDDHPASGQSNANSVLASPVAQNPSSKRIGLGTPSRRFVLDVQLDNRDEDGNSNTILTPPRKLASTAQTAASCSFTPLDYIIEQVLTGADGACLQGLQRLDNLITKGAGSMSGEMSPSRFDSLLAALAVRLREGFSTHKCRTPLLLKPTSDDNGGQGGVVDSGFRCTKHVIATLITLMEHAAVKEQRLGISILRLQQVLGEILQALASLSSSNSAKNPHSSDTNENSEMLLMAKRSLNTLLIRVLEGAPLGRVLSALIALLQETFVAMPQTDGSSSMSDTFSLPELILKCLWKCAKQVGERSPELLLPATPLLDEEGSKGFLDIHGLLQAMHTFLATLTPLEWKARKAQEMPLADLPLSTLKTILHELVNALCGQDDCSPLEDVMEWAKANLPQDSFALSYLQSMAASKLKSTTSTTPPPPPSQLNPVNNNDAQFAARRLSEDLLNERLRDICGRICSHPDTNVVNKLCIFIIIILFNPLFFQSHRCFCMFSLSVGTDGLVEVQTGTRSLRRPTH